MTIPDPAPQAAAELQYLDPATLLTDLNIRDIRLDPDFVASVKELGVLQPIIATRTGDWQARVRYGHRRTAAAIKAGLPAVPVLVVADEATGTQAQIDRIVGQYHENTHRAGLTSNEEASFVQQLLSLGMTEREIHRAARIPKDRVRAAQAVAGSETAQQAAEEHQLTLEQAAALAEFDDSPAVVKKLLASVESGMFAHELQRARDDRVRKQARDRLTAELEQAGVTVLAQHPGYDRELQLLAGPDGQRLTEETHRDCPGHAALIRSLWDEPYCRPDWYCTDPKAHGHRRYQAAAGGKPQTSEAARAERRLVRVANTAWRSAEKVRQAWLAEFLRRSTPPRDCMGYIAEMMARAELPFRKGLDDGHPTARMLLSLPEGTSRWDQPRNADLVQMLLKAPVQRQQVITVAMILGGYEAAAGVHVWRHPKSHHDIAAYLRTLAAWGYGLSVIEQAVADGTEVTLELLGEEPPDGAEPEPDEPDDLPAPSGNRDGAEPASEPYSGAEPPDYDPDADEQDEQDDCPCSQSE